MSLCPQRVAYYGRCSTSLLQRHLIGYGTTKSNVNKCNLFRTRSRALQRAQSEMHMSLQYSLSTKIAERIEHNVALLTFKALTTHQHAYLYDELQLCARTSHLRSNVTSNRLQSNSSKTVFVNRAFTTPPVSSEMGYHITVRMTFHLLLPFVVT